MVLLVIEVVYWIVILNAFYRFKEVKDKLVVLLKIIQSGFFIFFFLAYTFRYLVVGLRVNLSQGIETPIIVVILIIVVLEMVFMLLGLVYAIIFIFKKIFYSKKYPESINIIIYYKVPEGKDEKMGKNINNDAKNNKKKKK